MSATSRFPRTNKELEKLAKQWFLQCFHCSGLFHVNKAPSGEYFCASCKAVHVQHQRKAAAAMAKARRSGWKDKPEEFMCVDCGSQAEVWDHRSYEAPLDVEPVCHACNVRRGPASWKAA